MDENSIRFIKQIFEDNNVVKRLGDKFLVFGLQNGTQEA